MTSTAEYRSLYEEGLHILPEHMRDGVTRYIERGIRPGGFLTALLQGDAERAFMSADPANRACREEWRTFLADYAPKICHGSPLKFEAWCKIGGLSGLPE